MCLVGSGARCVRACWVGMRSGIQWVGECCPVELWQRRKSGILLVLGRMAELADARDLKSRVPLGTCGFDPRFGHCCSSSHRRHCSGDFTKQANRLRCAAKCQYGLTASCGVWFPKCHRNRVHSWPSCFSGVKCGAHKRVRKNTVSPGIYLGNGDYIPPRIHIHNLDTLGTMVPHGAVASGGNHSCTMTSAPASALRMLSSPDSIFLR